MISTVEKVLFLKAVPLFADVPGEELAQVALAAEELEREDGEEIVREGEAGDALYVVLAGRLGVSRNGKPVGELGEREIFGELALLDPAPRSATVRAVGEVRLLRLDREDFAEILSERPELARGVVQVLARRLREASAR